MNNAGIERNAAIKANTKFAITSGTKHHRTVGTAISPMITWIMPKPNVTGIKTSNILIKSNTKKTISLEKNNPDEETGRVTKNLLSSL